MENKLNIEYINIIKLFEKKDVKLNLKNLVNIYVGENGCGKTTVLKILKNIFFDNLRGLSKINFQEIQIKFKDEDIININHQNIFEWDSNISNFKRLIDKYKTKEKVIFLSNYRQLKYDFFVDVLDKIKDNVDNYIKTCEKFLHNKKLTFNFFKNIINIDILYKENLSKVYKLSDGERQILFIFSEIYLKNKKDIILLIDEPEISLSINWQKELIPEIVNTKNCSLIVAMTHSPFIFENEYFEKSTKEL